MSTRKEIEIKYYKKGLEGSQEDFLGLVKEIKVTDKALIGQILCHPGKDLFLMFVY